MTYLKLKTPQQQRENVDRLFDSPESPLCFLRGVAFPFFSQRVSHHDSRFAHFIAQPIEVKLSLANINLPRVFSDVERLGRCLIQRELAVVLLPSQVPFPDQLEVKLVWIIRIANPIRPRDGQDW